MQLSVKINGRICHPPAALLKASYDRFIVFLELSCLLRLEQLSSTYSLKFQIPTTMSTDKQDTVHIDEGVNASHMEELDMDKSECVPEARGREADEMPEGYFHSIRFIGAYCATGFGFMAATGGYALIAPLLGEINVDIGPSANITWVALAYLLTQSVVFLIVGRLSDVFGRRWFFIGRSILSSRGYQY